MDGAGGEEVVRPWMRASEILEASIDEDALLTAYFAVKGDEAAARQSITLDARQNSTVATVSLDPGLMADLADASWRLAALAGWAMETFDTAVLACGAELDLHEVGHEANPCHIEARLSSDSRCRYVMTARRLGR